jgi:hypothetical protein
LPIHILIIILTDVAIIIEIKTTTAKLIPLFKAGITKISVFNNKYNVASMCKLE